MTKQIQERQRGASAKSISKLTAQQQIYLKALLASKNFNLTEAARVAGYKNPEIIGPSLIKNPVIRAAVGKELRLRKERLEWEADDVLSFLRAVVEMDITELYDTAGNISMEKLKELPKIQRRCISSIKTKRKFFTNEDGEREYYNQIEVEWMSKDQALHLALKHFGLLNDDLKVHVMDEKVKQRIIVELLGQIAGRGSVIDAEAVERLALEAPADPPTPSNDPDTIDASATSKDQ